MKYFTIRELSASATARARGIDNTPTASVRASLTALTDNVLDPLRQHYGRPVIVNSGYRCPALNAAVGGAATSQHLRGEAADITATDKRDNRLLFDYIRNRLPYDQLIWEKGNNDYPQWIHVSFSRTRNRKQILYTK